MLSDSQKEAIRERIAAKSTAGPPMKRPLERIDLSKCIHLGDLVSCQSCGGTLRTCNLLGGTTTRFTVPDSKADHCCVGCTSKVLPPQRNGRKPKPPRANYPEITTRHLLYHVYPMNGNGVWQRNVALLRQRLPLFNGKRLVAVAIDPPEGRGRDPVGPGGPDTARYLAPTDSLELVRDAFGSDADSIEFIELQNDPTLREVVSFLPLFSAVETTDPSHAIFYGQAKGVTRNLNHPAQRWAEVLYQVYLDFWHLVSAELKHNAATGAFKKIGMGWSASQSPSQWHYSGSWMWVRCDKLFTRDWRSIRQWWGGIESYLSERFTAAETGCLFMERPVPKLNLYDAGFWKREVEPQLAKFVRSHSRSSSRWLNVGCGPFPMKGWLNVDVVREGHTQPDVLIERGKPLPFHDGFFERVYAGHVLEHIRWEDVVPFLEDVARVVRKGGEICIVVPDSKLVLGAWKRGETSEKMVWDILEDANHHQYEALDRDWEGARHYWNATGARVVAAMRQAGLTDAKEVPLSSLESWPVVDRAGPYQSAIVATVPS